LEATKGFIMIRNIWAVGRNYKAHAKEMGAAVTSKPMIFLKAGSSASLERDVPLYAGSKEIHHELEIALRFGPDLDAAGQLQFNAAAVALDLTARDIQAELKTNSHPWTLAKSFKHSCPLSAMVAITSTVPHFEFQLTVNDVLRQTGNTRDMIFDFETLRRYVCENFPVEPGDLLLTGTPSGVASLKPNDTANASFKSDAGHEVRMEWVFR
jgi:acylpyruvate hydrolase